jgi:arylsulfate sulfotransferase
MASSMQTRVGVVLAVVLVVAACSSTAGGDPSTPPPSSARAATAERGDGAPARVDVALAPAAPLVAEVVVAADEPVVPTVVAVAADHEVAGPDTPAATDHRIALAGLRADTAYEVEVTVHRADGSPLGDVVRTSVATAPVPADMPDLRLVTSEPDRMAPGVTLFNLLDIGDLPDPDEVGDAPPQSGLLVAVDAEGEIVWYHRAAHPMGDVRQLPGGDLLVEYNDTAARRINLFGEVVGEWAGELIRTDFERDIYGRRVVGEEAVPVAVESMHHEHAVLPNGNHITLSTELRVIDGFAEPLCGEDPADFDGAYHLIGDVIVEFDPADGEVVASWSLFDYFPLPEQGAIRNVCGIPLGWVFPNWMYQGADPRARDWTHANAVALDEERNALIVSIRHLDAVIAIRHRDDAAGPAGELLWELGPHGTLDLVSGGWSYHQHAPEVQADGTILLYDNGNGRPGDDPPHSRAVLYAVDAAAGTVEQLWEHRSRVGDQLILAPFVGDADRLANGNVLVTDGGLQAVVDGVSAQIVEVVPAAEGDGGDRVFELRVEGGPSWVVYRAERLPSLYG